MLIQNSKKYASLTAEQKEIVNAYETNFEDSEMENEDTATAWIEEALSSYATYGEDEDLCLHIVSKLAGCDEESAKNIMPIVDRHKVLELYSEKYMWLNGYYFKK